MDRVSSSNYPEPDKFGSGKNGFRAGNPLTSTPATIPGAAWFNAVQEEVCRVIEGAGLTLDSASYTQLLTAIQSLNQTAIATALKYALFTNTQGSIGIGITPKKWGAQYPSVQLNAKTAIAADANSSYYDLNRYNDPTTSKDLRLGAGYALRYQQNAALGHHKLQTAVSAAADSEIAWVDVVDVDPDGNVSVPGKLTVGGVVISNPASARGVRSNLYVNYTGTSGVVTVSAAELVLENGSNSYLTLRNVNQSATSGYLVGANGLDAGNWAYSTWYFLYVIYNPTTSTTALLWSPSATSPVLPAGYTYYALVSVNKTQSATNYWFRGGWQEDRTFWYRVAAGSNVTALPITISGVQGSISGPTWVSASLLPDVPATAVVAKISMYCSSGTAAVAPNSAYGAYTSTSNPPPVGFSVSSGTVIIPADMPLESTNIYFCSSTGNAGVQVRGWEVNL